SVTYAVTKRYSTPFGGPRGTKAGNWPDDKAFLGKPADDATGLTHVGAREYDPGLGQFISVDPVLTLDQHQSLNGYSYANNAPATASDPTGLTRHLDPGGGCDPKTCSNLDWGKDGGKGFLDDLIDAGVYPKGTAVTDSNGNTASGQRYSCSGTGPAEICKPITGPGDSSSNGGNFLSSLFGSGDFWSSFIDTMTGAIGVGGGAFLVATGVVECGTGILCPIGAAQIAGGAGIAALGAPYLKSGSDGLGQAFREAQGSSASGSTSEVNGGMGSLVKVNKPDASADELAVRLRGESRVKFENDPEGREFDAVSDTYVAQAKPAGFRLGKKFRQQAQATFKMAKTTGRVPYFQFDGAPGAGVVDAIRRYSQRYNMPAVIDTEPIIVP
ncbi:restriction endonuclease fold toxin, partial [Streptomyces sp. NPDC008313]|uniref:restriction endonuclease fold toxin n=1 Tax=Streptomyces sp. NPDC008313 TaxID=3364826 RepID=UPI0036EFAADA